ncbi:MAG: HoxN/HupN/NixA family nickel/cobalt transporter [Gemmatimonadaceae bacterium]
MTHLLAVAALGFFLGMRHATDPDHIVAVSTIVARQRSVRAAAMTGAVWALGHTLTILVVGGAIILFGWLIPDRVGLSMELSVGVMLIVLGLMNLVSASRSIDASARPPVESVDLLGGSRVARPLIVGVVHGLAGSAAIALLVLAVIGRSSWSLLYLLIFGVGTIVGMMLVTAAIGIPFAAAGSRAPRWNRTLRIASGAISLVFGLLIAYKIGVVDGLFGNAPTWTPK